MCGKNLNTSGICSQCGYGTRMKRNDDTNRRRCRQSRVTSPSGYERFELKDGCNINSTSKAEYVQYDGVGKIERSYLLNILIQHQHETLKKNPTRVQFAMERV